MNVSRKVTVRAALQAIGNMYIEAELLGILIHARVLPDYMSKV